MTITLGGRIQCLVDDMIGAWTPGSKVAGMVACELRDKVFPPEVRQIAELPGQPGRFDTAKLQALPVREIDLTDPEAEALAAALQKSEPLVTVEHVRWFYGLLDEVQAHLKEKANR